MEDNSVSKNGIGYSEVKEPRGKPTGNEPISPHYSYLLAAGSRV